jgi:RNA-directed DNA polymerase
MKNRKVHSLTGRITPELVYAAWRSVRANRGAAGIDKVSVWMFEQNLQPNLHRVLREMKDGSLRPMPVRRVYIQKAPGKFRPLGIPTVCS